MAEQSSSDDRVQTRQTIELTLTLNGEAWSGTVPVEEVLLDFLRDRVGLTGAKRSCESEVCGACTVLVDDKPISACTYLAFEANGKTVTTIEGLARGDRLDPLQEAFIQNVGLQCGYCTPGQIMTSRGLLLENPTPTYDEVAHWLTNLCRCGAYPAIAASVLEAARARQSPARGPRRSVAAARWAASGWPRRVMGC
jgi:carbon-monoxide dehydrogenase small subunit